VAIAPVMAAVAIGIKLTSPGPIFFKQKRYGFNNEIIEVFKFRSMHVEQCSADQGPVAQATRDDDRITPFGRILRRTSLDELPQFINVVRGDMSIVGPRPHAVAHNEQYAKLIDEYLARHKVKPGITGWAQVNGLRGETDTLVKMERRVQYDLHYIENWSLALDLRIILMTILVGFSDPNAY
jgi:exopolysaccharide biosynthesis polyprenyl glycosylphosphotransferase